MVDKVIDRNDVLDLRGKPRVQTVNTDPSMTVQSDAHLADISQILKGHGAGSLLESLDDAELLFADVSEFTDLADALRQAAIAEVQFLKLPSKVREIFGHDVAQWLDTAHDEGKRDELAKAGFLADDPKVVPEGTKEPLADAGKADAGTASGSGSE